MVTGAVRLTLGALAVQYVPSVVTLGAWTPLRALPGGLCRWQGPPTAQVALTFDDGPSPEATPRVLDHLDALGLRATFFCLGSLAERQPDLLAEVARRGHQIETHGYRHEHHLARGPRWVERDLATAVGVMTDLGHRPTWYRPSYGQLTASTLVAARRHRVRTVLWSAWGREWTTTDPGQVAARIASRLAPGAIVMLHDNDAFGTPGMWKVGEAALDRVAEDLERRRLSAVTLDELVGAP
ncbi:MAG TPA: polysaccharide deacetylase family protein [Acidimicrobiales bacterium]|nr:polysaccharide deacetylase family protein [Acidimicrobiales bacterium]